MNGGPVVKVRASPRSLYWTVLLTRIQTNAKQRYASTALTTFLLRRVASEAGVPLRTSSFLA